MIFADQWANRHDGACETEQRVKVYGNVMFLVDCNCYRRFLEGRLGELQTAASTLVMCAANTLGLGEDRPGATRRIERTQIAIHTIRALLPPKGAGE